MDGFLQEILNICIAAMAVLLATKKSNPVGTPFEYSFYWYIHCQYSFAILQIKAKIPKNFCKP